MNILRFPPRTPTEARARESHRLQRMLPLHFDAAEPPSAMHGESAPEPGWSRIIGGIIGGLVLVAAVALAWWPS
jgi:hypothetical protein